MLAGGTEGPVLLCMPGTNGAAWQSSMLETAHEFIARWHDRGPMAIVSVRNGLKMRDAQHRRIAKWTFPLWMYVSVTGVIVYFFLYHWFPS